MEIDVFDALEHTLEIWIDYSHEQIKPTQIILPNVTPEEENNIYYSGKLDAYVNVLKFVRELKKLTATPPVEPESEPVQE